MSRALKFRAWDKKYKQGIPLSHIKIRLDGKLDLPPHCDEENVVIEQCTGLKDKNGKEIYEGDIVKMPEWQVKPKHEAVKYRKAGFDPFQEGCWDCCKPDGEEVEIIGNIHENPELLGGEE